MSYTIKGTVKKIDSEQRFGDKFHKKTIVVDVSETEKYESPIPVDYINDDIDLISQAEVGDRVSIRVELQGRWGKNKYEGRAWLSLVGLSYDAFDEPEVTAKSDDQTDNIPF